VVTGLEPIRLGIIGGGPGSFIGEAHRVAARMDGRFRIIAGVVSSDSERSVRLGPAVGIPVNRAYPDVQTMLRSEGCRPDGIQAVAILSPNDTHHRFAVDVLRAGCHVLCEKPLANSLEDGQSIARAARQAGRIVALAHVYSGYPVVRQARAMVRDGDLGIIRLVQVEYVHGGAADESVPDDPKGPRGWKFIPGRIGPSQVLGDIGTHAHHLLRFVSGLEVDQVRADIGSIVPGRRIFDYAGVLMRLENGARGYLWTTRAAAGIENDLMIRLSGTRGSLEWRQESPQRLDFRPLDRPAELRTQGGPGTHGDSARLLRYRAGHPEGFLEALANIYAGFADAVAGRAARSLPTAEDGIEGLRFIDACLESNRHDGRWTFIGRK